MRYMVQAYSWQLWLTSQLGSDNIHATLCLLHAHVHSMHYIGYMRYILHTPRLVAAVLQLVCTLQLQI